MNIEFIGLPGSGKTTIANRVISYNKNINLHSNVMSNYNNYIDAYSVMTSFYITLSYLLLNNKMNHSIKLKRVLKYMMIKKYYESKDDIVIYDQGIMQILSESNISSGHLDEFSKIVLNHFIGNIYILVMTDEKTSANRLCNRKEMTNHNKTNYDYMPYHKILKYYKKLTYIQNIIIDKLYMNNTIIRVNGADSVNMNAQYILKKMNI